MKKLSSLVLALSSMGIITDAFASDFSLPFVNSAGLGVVYADWATATSDASAAYTNPAALPSLNQAQFVGNLLGILGSTTFTGSAKTPPYQFFTQVSQSGSASSPIRAFMPSLYLAAPLNDRLSFGFNVTTPFGLGTQYPKEAITRYAATRSQVVGIDIGPSLGFKLTDYLSIGAGFDALRLDFTLSNMYGPPPSLAFGGDTGLENKLDGWGYGGHAGVLLNLPTKTKIGFSYYSQISIDTDGFSTVYAPSGAQLSTRLQETDSTLPARAQFSVQQDLNDRWTAMATAFYTNWKTFKELTMKRTMTPTGQLVSVTIPFNYHNCFDYAVGATYKVNEKILLRGGLEFMNSPSNDVDRGIADPIGGATVIGIGAHYEASKALSYDVGVGHSFFKKQSINFRNQLTSLSGSTETQTTVIGAQLNWNFN